MRIIGLTGGIGMGKSAIAKILRAFGFTVWSADKAVHEALRPSGKAFALVAAKFPETVKHRRINRKILGRIVFNNPRKLRKLEKILHPLVKESELSFVQQARNRNTRAIVLEIPLLFETGADARCDLTLCASAPADTQRARVLPRPNMNEKTFLSILERQLPDAEKCKRADYIVPTGASLAETREYLRELFSALFLLDPPRPPKGRTRRKNGSSRQPS